MTDGIPIGNYTGKNPIMITTPPVFGWFSLFLAVITSKKGVHFKMKVQMNREQKEKQIRREAKATLILFVVCFVWNVGFAYGLSGTGVRLFGLPLWWLISTPGMFIIAVIGVFILLKKVFVNFDLEDIEEGGDLNA